MGGRESGDQKKKSDKKYYHVMIEKLADAFERQFFTSIHQL